MNFKVLFLAAIAAMFVVSLSGCSGETGTDEVKSITKDMKSDASDKTDTATTDVSNETTMGPPGGKTSQRMGGGK